MESRLRVQVMCVSTAHLKGAVKLKPERVSAPGKALQRNEHVFTYTLRLTSCKCINTNFELFLSAFPLT